MKSLIKIAVNRIYLTFLIFCIWSTASKAQSVDSFRLVLCNKTIEEKAIEDIFLIDSATNDTINAKSLLNNKEILLNKKKMYNVVLVGRRKWNYLFQLKRDTKHYCDYCKHYTLCYNSKAILTRKSRQADISLFDGKTDLGFFSKIVSKKGKKLRGKYLKFYDATFHGG